MLFEIIDYLSLVKNVRYIDTQHLLEICYAMLSQHLLVILYHFLNFFVVL